MDNNIDMINNIALNTSGSGLEAPKKSEPAPKEPVDTADTTVKSDYASVIDRALEQEEIDIQAVKKAQQDIENGQLDTPENITATAEYILKYGI